MSSPGLSDGAVKDAGPRHTQRNSLKHHKYGRKSASAQDNEEAPLLADDAPNGDIEADTAADSPMRQPAIKRENARRFFQKAAHWLWSNKMILAITLLLFGGVIALLVYFTSMYGPSIHILFSSR